MRLVQFLNHDGQSAVAKVAGDRLQLISKYSSTYELANEAIVTQQKIGQLVAKHLSSVYVDYDDIIASDRLLPPVLHPDPLQFWITGTGLTHSGSAATRDAMHKVLEKEENLSDSLKIFKMGLEGGKTAKGEIGVQPEWFYKGNGTIVVPPNGTLDFPTYALDGGEEPEIVGLYLIGPDGSPNRIGFALGNEYSDHRMERINYLYLAHSKLRKCSFGPELLVGDLPDSVAGKVSVIRGQESVWSKEFLSGEEHMIHSIANLEYHHFKYELFRTPGHLHGHFFGTATFSFSDGIEIQDGDRFQIESNIFGKPLWNTVKKKNEKTVKIKML
ncbi:MAG: FAH family protein [Pricia sp.]|nr:FAH family protein [Pricia sp.]